MVKSNRNASKQTKERRRNQSINDRRRNANRNLRGLDTTRLPTPPNLKHAKVPVSDKVTAWSNLLKEPFSAESAGVYPPITNNVVPCPSTKVRNYGTTAIEILPGKTHVGMWLYPEGILTVNGLRATMMDPLFLTDVPYTVMGPVLDGADIAQSAAIGVYYQADVSSDAFLTTPPVALSGSVQVVPMPWDQLQNPFAVPKADSDVKFRNTAFGIRISYAGRLLDTEGFVDFYNPFVWPATPAEPRTMASLRRDPSHRRIYFGNQRTATFVWHPNCESSQYGKFDRSGNFDPDTFVSRMMLSIGGVESGDKFEVEYIGFNEYTGHPAIATNTPSPVALDVTHLANAIPALNGKMNRGASAGRVSTLAQHVAATKVIALPKHIAPKASGQDIHHVVKTMAKGKGDLFTDILDVALPFLAM